MKSIKVFIIIGKVLGIWEIIGDEKLHFFEDRRKFFLKTIERVGRQSQSSAKISRRGRPEFFVKDRGVNALLLALKSVLQSKLKNGTESAVFRKLKK